MQDEALLRLLRQDPSAGLRAAMDHYMGLVLAVIRGRLAGTRPEEDVEECAADVFTALYTHRAGLDAEKGSLKAWLCVVARRKAIDLVRGGKNPSALSLDDEDAVYDPPKTPSAEEDFEAAHRRRLLAEAVEALPMPDREIIMRKYYYGQPSKEIGPQVGLSPGAVDTRASRAMVRLRRQMEESSHGE